MEGDEALKDLSDFLEGVFSKVDYEANEDALHITFPVEMSKRAYGNLREAIEKNDPIFMRKFCRWMVIMMDSYMWEQLNGLKGLVDD